MVTKQEIEAARTQNGGWTREQLASWGIRWPPPAGWKDRLLTLTPQRAAELYAGWRWSVCQIQRLYPRMTRAGVEARVREAGLAGVMWCPLCRTYEQTRAE